MTAIAADVATSNARAMAAMVGSQAVLTVNDALMKLAAQEVPGGEAIFIRGLVTTALAAGLALALGSFRGWPSLARQWHLVAMRNAGEVGATLLYLTALFHMPIADATAILQVVPLATVAGAALFLGEPVGWRRWLATAVGFAGVLLIIRPGTSAFNAWSLVALSAIAAITLRDLATRRIDRGVPTVLLTVLSGIAVSLMAASLSFVEVWRPPGPKAIALAGGAAVFVLAGYMLIIHAMRHGEVAVVAPFRYSVIVWAVLAGIFVFGETVDPVALLGTSIVMAAGLYTFFRERQIRLRSRPANAQLARPEGDAAQEPK